MKKTYTFLLLFLSLINILFSQDLNSNLNNFNKTDTTKKDIIGQNNKNNPNKKFRGLNKIYLTDTKFIRAKLLKYDSANIIKCETQDGFLEFYKINSIKNIEKIQKRNVITDLYFWKERFTWKEFIPDIKSPLLTEQGTISGLGFKQYGCIYGILRYDIKLEYGGGKIDYDGQTQSGNPVSTKTKYNFYKSEFNLGAKLYEKGLYEEIYIGLGIQFWNRNIESTPYATGGSEYWKCYYNSLGIKGGIKLNRTANLIYNFCIKNPLINNETSKLPYYDKEIELNPGCEFSYYYEAGFKMNKIKITAYGETLRFSESNWVRFTYGEGYFTYPVSVYQPKSHGMIWGLKAGLSF